jgi:hypothetical protein
MTIDHSLSARIDHAKGNLLHTGRASCALIGQSVTTFDIIDGFRGETRDDVNYAVAPLNEPKTYRTHYVSQSFEWTSADQEEFLQP